VGFELGYGGELYMLAFDHRDVFRELPRPVEAKRVVYEGFLRGVAGGIPRVKAGLLVDEEFGADIARDALVEGFVVAMPVERSGCDEFEFEYGEGWREHLAEFEPQFAKVLVRWGAGDPQLDGRQARTLAELSDWLHLTGRKLLFELILAEVSVDGIVAAMEELRSAGVEPDVWKLQGLDSPEECREAAAAARAGDRRRVRCIALGAGAEADVVRGWLAAAAAGGYAGFAVGRTLWADELRTFLAGDRGREEAAERIGQNYLGMAEAYAAAAPGGRVAAK
jgi:myo-inositol catabolism protein IolC